MSKMGNYSIKDLEHLSGIKAHTLRIWEKRYNIIQPKRTDTNIRYYSDADLKKVLNISILNNHGLKISKIADLSSGEISERISELEQNNHNDDFDLTIDKLIVGMIELNEALFVKQLEDIVLKIGFRSMVINVLYPFLQRIGVLWQTGNISPAQEHFITHLIRQKIISAIDKLSVPQGISNYALLFLPENEWHEIGLLFANYICREQGINTVYLGQSVPYGDILSVAKDHQPDYLISYITAQQTVNQMKSFVGQLAKDFPKTQILISGNSSKLLVGETLSHNITLFKDAQALKANLK